MDHTDINEIFNQDGYAGLEDLANEFGGEPSQKEVFDAIPNHVSNPEAHGDQFSISSVSSFSIGAASEAVIAANPKIGALKEAPSHEVALAAKEVLASFDFDDLLDNGKGSDHDTGLAGGVSGGIGIGQ